MHLHVCVCVCAVSVSPGVKLRVPMWVCVHVPASVAWHVFWCSKQSASKFCQMVPNHSLTTTFDAGTGITSRFPPSCEHTLDIYWLNEYLGETPTQTSSPGSSTGPQEDVRGGRSASARWDPFLDPECKYELSGAFAPCPLCPGQKSRNKALTRRSLAV